jgi:predicted DNA-binding protein
MDELQPTSVRLEPELKERLKQFAAQDRRSLSSYIVIVLENHAAERDKAEAKAKR